MKKQKWGTVITLAITGACMLAVLGCGFRKNVANTTPGGTTASPGGHDIIGGLFDDNPEKGLVVQEAATKNITWESYTTPEGYMSIQIPSGWVVEPTNVDTIGYILRIYDPQNPNRFIFFETACASLSCVEAAEYYGMTTSTVFINPEPTAQSLFENSGDVFNYTDFTLVDNLGTTNWGGDILQATVTRGGETCEGLFSSIVQDVGPYYMGEYDMMYDVTNATVVLMAPEYEFVDWQPVLEECFSTLTFSDSYMQARKEAGDETIETSYYLSEQSKSMSDSIMSSWEARSNTYDIMSQEQSDATLGYDRYVDTQTGETYRVEYGIMDGYSGTRYEKVESGSDLYNQAVSGYITK